MAKTPPYRIETARLVLRCWEPRDAAAKKAAIDASREHLSPSMPWARENPLSLDQHIQQNREFRARFDSDQDYIYSIWDREETEVLGGCGLHTRRGPHTFEIGYWIAVDKTQKGFATELTRALTEVGFEYCKKARMEIFCSPENIPSRRIPHKLGYVHEVTRRQFYPGIEEGELRDTMIWTMLREEFPTPALEQSVIGAAYDAAGRKIYG
jgi:RimJ/RimL family protein N-acetyltransferase